jgi:hypothetical protein
MTNERDTARIVRSWLEDGSTAMPDRVLDAVLADLPSTPQRRSWWPLRRFPVMKPILAIAGAAAVVVALVIGVQLLGPAAPAGVGGAPSAEPTPPPSPSPIGGSVTYQMGGATTTEVDAVADGASVSGTAVTTSGAGTHTVRLECADRDGDTWVLAGKVEQTTVSGEKAGYWSAVLVRDGSPQLVGIWFSADPPEGSDCDGWLAASDFSTLGLGEFAPVESGALVPPPDLAP